MKRILVTLLLATLLLPAFAQDQQATGAGDQAAPGAQAQPAEGVPATVTAPQAGTDMPPEPPRAYGLVQKGLRSTEGRDFLVLADPAGGEILFAAEAEPDTARMNAVLSLTSALRAWSGSDLPEIRVVNYVDRFQLHAIAARFLAGGQDVSARIPGGLQFFYQDGAYEYDFRFKAADLFIRVRGVYSSSADLSLVLQRVLMDPAAYVKANDPLFALKGLEESEARIAALEQTVAELKAQLAEMGPRLSEATAQLRKDLQALSAKESSDRLRAVAGAAAALNGGKAIRQDAVSMILDLKAADPRFDKTKAVARLKDGGITITQKEADAVFLAAFGE